MKNLADIHLQSGVPLRDLERAAESFIRRSAQLKSVEDAVRAYYNSFAKIRRHPSMRLLRIVQAVLYHWPNKST